MPYVSIIVPFFNGEKYIRRCLENLLNQNFENYEIILIDDNSTDNSKDTLKNIMYVSNRIKYFFLDDKTIGVGKARNYGIKKATGKYIMFVDIDDLIDESLLMHLKPFMDKNIDIIKYNMKIVQDDNTSFDTKYNNASVITVTGEKAFNKLCFKDKLLDSPCVYLIKREYFKSLNLQFLENVYNEDFGLIPILLAKAKTASITNFISYYYIQSKDSIMRNNDYSKTLERVKHKFLHYENMIRILEKSDISMKTKENLKRYYTNSILVSLKDLNSNDIDGFKKRFKDMRLIRNLKPKSLKQLIKFIMIKFYLK